MKIELVKFEKKHLPKLIVNSMNWSSLKSAGFFDKENMAKNFKFYASKKIGYYFAVTADEIFVGNLNLIEEKVKGNFSLGIFIFKKYWNLGIASESVKKILKMSPKLGIKKITAVTFLDNYYSEKILRKNKFRKVRNNDKNNYWEKKI